MIFDILSDSVKYAISKPKNILILGIANIFNFLIIPEFIIQGYEYRVTKKSLDSMINEDNTVSPDFSDIKGLIIDGAKLIFVQILYYIIPFILFVLSMFLLIKGINSLYDIIGIFLFVFSLISIVILRIYSFISVPHMIKHNSIKKAFDFKNINKVIKNIGVSNLVIICLVLTFIATLFASWGDAFANVFIYIFNINESACFLNNLFPIFDFNSHIFISRIFVGLIFAPFIKILSSRSSGLLYNDI